MNILGISAFYHDSACCLMQDGKLIAAASEERFSRIKHDNRLPVHAFRYCLTAAGLHPDEIDCIAYYENPVKKSGRQLAYYPYKKPGIHIVDLNPLEPLRLIREHLGFRGKIVCFDHHLSHAASAYYFSGFEESAILTVDGVGEWATTAYGVGNQGGVSLFEQVNFPHSLGLLYATITAYLGFRVNSGEYKVMGLAAYGQPTYLDQLRQTIALKQKGQYRLNLDYFDFERGTEMYSPLLQDLLKLPTREPESAIRTEHENLACSMQRLLEEILLEKLDFLQNETDQENLCMAGGVALNAVANARIRREGPFQRVFFQPVAGDAGGAIGAAALATRAIADQKKKISPVFDLYLGPKFSNDDVVQVLSATGVPYGDYSGKEDDFIQAVLERLLENQIIGWFQGRMEFGPRALGARSILANPMGPDVQDRINRVIKKREAFRPFAPVVLWPEAQAHFDLHQPAPFMIETCKVTSALSLPAVTHIDGTARPQTLDPNSNPRLYRLLSAFYERTGCPMLVNTSFNQRGEPIVCDPVDALRCLGTSELDALVIEDFILDKTDTPANWQKLIEAWGPHPGQASVRRRNNLYAFT